MRRCFLLRSRASWFRTHRPQVQGCGNPQAWSKPTMVARRTARHPASAAPRLRAPTAPAAGPASNHGEQLTRAGDVAGAGAAGEQAVVTDAVESVRQDVDQETADELGG